MHTTLNVSFPQLMTHDAFKKIFPCFYLCFIFRPQNIDVSSIIYMPKNLLPEFYVDSLNVRIKYNVVERVNCGMVKDAYQAIFIEEIQKK